MVANSLKDKKHEEASLEKKQQNDNSRKNRKRKLRTRKFPIWLRIIVVLFLAVGCLVVGLMVGYSVVGNGHATEILDKQTWQHIIDIVMKEK